MIEIRTTSRYLPAYKKYVRIEDATHESLRRQGYLKIDLPVLSPALIPESYIEIFKTQYRYFDTVQDLFLTPSPELFLKRLLTEGIGSCYSLGKAFRNAEAASSLHFSEFTMLEFYKMHANYMDVADDLLVLLRDIARAVNGSDAITYHDRKFTFDAFEMISVAEAYSRFASITSDELFDAEKFRAASARKGYTAEGFSYEDLFSQIYVQEIEPQLGTRGLATVLYDYPKEFAALAQLNADGLTAKRFEFYIAGIELGDCYSELTDPVEQEDRFDAEFQKRSKSGKIEHPIDTGFIDALKKGLEPCAGIAIGFDRLAMIFGGEESIDRMKLIQITQDS